MCFTSVNGHFLPSNTLIYGPVIWFGILKIVCKNDFSYAEFTVYGSIFSKFLNVFYLRKWLFPTLKYFNLRPRNLVWNFDKGYKPKIAPIYILSILHLRNVIYPLKWLFTTQNMLTFGPVF